jgi:6-pyruvoyltetrahydropterin/6-carboxytetrahydropterin synthase
LQIRRHFRFEAAHALPFHSGKCAQMHGHSYRLEVAVRGPLQSAGSSRGMIADFDDVRRVVHEHAVDLLDHQTLNELIENPTAERIVMWLWERLDPVLEGLDELVLWETTNACAILRRSDFPGSSPAGRAGN